VKLPGCKNALTRDETAKYSTLAVKKSTGVLLTAALLGAHYICMRHTCSSTKHPLCLAVVSLIFLTLVNKLLKIAGNQRMG
jgi:hypothetical protein